MMRIVVVIVAVLTSLMARAELEVSGKHLLVLQARIDSIWGKYLFSVNNQTTDQQPLRFPLLLPKETEDFRALEGVSDDDLQLDDDGSIVIDKKDFPPGTTLVNIGFKKTVVESATLTFRITEPLASLVILFDEMIDVKSPLFEPTVAPKISAHNYRALQSKNPLTSGETLVLQVDDVPRGRARIQVVAGIFAFMLLGCATLLTIKSFKGVGGAPLTLW